MRIGNHWDTIRQLFDEAQKSCFHFALATVRPDGTPDVAPIGSLILRDDFSGYYLEEFPLHMAANIKSNPRVSVLAVNADKLYWGKSLFEGTFSTPPAVRLYGTAGGLRKATKEEVEAWQKKVALASKTKGYKVMWENMSQARDIVFDSFEPVVVGSMTEGLWAGK
jgi:hypothetical protein